ncbi:hypothetical protein LTR66_000656 [Elasticomyces elasticus]|nr:hypothetical protein LTR66_000656 [Elasticomyces elasticus]
MAVEFLDMTQHYGRNQIQHGQHHYQRFTHTQTRAHQPHPGVASSLVSSPYSRPHPEASVNVRPSSSTQTLSSSSSSTRVAHKPLLPSISNLLGIVNDGERVNHDSSCQDQIPAQLETQSHTQHDQQQHRNIYSMQPPPTTQPESLCYQPGSSYVTHPEGHFGIARPPTPSTRSDSVVGSTHSPSTISTGFSASGQVPYFMGSLNNLEPHQQRVSATHMVKRHSIASQPSASPYTISPNATSSYTSSPSVVSQESFYSPDISNYTSQDLYHQRPLSTNFPPPPPPPVPPPAPAPNSTRTTTPSLPTTANLWQHHHYISASSQATFPQSQDRYICQACNKAFSRPSSLKIHSHSHTGEKPFKCPHAGCGKAFSVRSNMKRHERGCHGGIGDVAVASAG